MSKGYHNQSANKGSGRHHNAERKFQQRMAEQRGRRIAKKAKEGGAKVGGEAIAPRVVLSLVMLLRLLTQVSAQRGDTLTFKKGKFSSQQCPIFHELHRDCNQYIGVNADGIPVVGYTVDSIGRVTEERYRDKDGHWQTRTQAPSVVRLEAFDDCAEKFVRQEVQNWYVLRGAGFQLCDLDSPEYKRVRGTGVLEGLALQSFDCHQAQNNFRVAMKGCHNEADAAVLGAWVYGVAVVGGLIAVGGVAYLGYKLCKDGIECPSLFRRSGSYDITTRHGNDEEPGNASAASPV